MQREPIWERANGRWHGILAGIGVPDKSLRNRHGPCPICGGKDRFRFDNKGGNGTWICNQCGAGTGVKLVEMYLGVDFKEAARVIEQHLGSAPVATRNGKQVESDSKQREELIALWDRAKPIEELDAAGLYLASRVGAVEFPTCLRFASDERYVDPGERPSWHAAMIARVDPCDEAKADGERSALHRTYLSSNGAKADVSSPRKMMGTMPRGAAVRLMEHDDVLGIAEGIETAFSASTLFGIPVWAALTAGLLQDWVPPASVKTVFVFADNDVSFAGQAAAFSLARRLKAGGISVFVEMPSTMGKDWNDVHQDQKGTRL